MSRAPDPCAVAVALLTRKHLGAGIPRRKLLKGADEGEVLKAMEGIASGILAGACPRDDGAALLQQIGLHFAGPGAAT